MDKKVSNPYKKTVQYAFEQWVKNNCKRGERVEVQSSPSAFVVTKRIQFAYTIKDKRRTKSAKK